MSQSNTQYNLTKKVSFNESSTKISLKIKTGGNPDAKKEVLKMVDEIFALIGESQAETLLETPLETLLETALEIISTPTPKLLTKSLKFTAEDMDEVDSNVEYLLQFTNFNVIFDEATPKTFVEILRAVDSINNGDAHDPTTMKVLLHIAKNVTITSVEQCENILTTIFCKLSTNACSYFLPAIVNNSTGLRSFIRNGTNRTITKMFSSGCLNGALRILILECGFMAEIVNFIVLNKIAENYSYDLVKGLFENAKDHIRMNGDNVQNVTLLLSTLYKRSLFTESERKELVAYLV